MDVEGVCYKVCVQVQWVWGGERLSWEDEDVFLGEIIGNESLAFYHDGAVGANHAVSRDSTNPLKNLRMIVCSEESVFFSRKGDVAMMPTSFSRVSLFCESVTHDLCRVTFSVRASHTSRSAEVEV